MKSKKKKKARKGSPDLDSVAWKKRMAAIQAADVAARNDYLVLSDALAAVSAETMTAIDRLWVARKLLKTILDHQVANLNSDNEFYRCYTYNNNQMPDWVYEAKAFLGYTPR